MKKRIVLISLQVMMLIITSCSTTKVVSDVNEAYNFNNVESFSLAYDDTRSNQVVNELNKARIEKAIISEMQSRGLKLDRQNPDVVINYFTKVEVEKDVYVSGSATGNGYGRYGYRGMNVNGSKHASVETTTNGYIVTEVVDKNIDDMIWYSYGKKTINTETTGEKASENITSAIEEIMEPFPVEKIEKSK